MDKKYLSEIFNLVGSENLEIDESKRKEFGKDHCHYFSETPDAVVFPKSEKMLMRLLRWCNQNKIPVVPSGGRTGYSGGASASTGQIVISLSKMNKIKEIDTISGTLTVESGCILQNMQEKAREKGLLFPVDLAARGSAMAGGLVATNAGGLRVIKYGMTRENLLGLRVVMANGNVLNLGGKLRKSNSGYNLMHLMCASEGTLGIISEVTFRLVAPPQSPQSILLAVKNAEQIPQLLQRAREQHLDILAFEFYSDICESLVLRSQPYRRQPFATRHAWNILIEVDTRGNPSLLEQFTEEIFSEELVADGILAQHSRMTKELWEIRENISECINLNQFYYKTDVVVPISELSDTLSSISLLENPPHCQILLFGHVGDGNIHVNLVGDDAFLTEKEFEQNRKLFVQTLSNIIWKRNGSMSAEHGIGLLKKELLKLQAQPGELNLMRQIKAQFDPNKILNPGKIFG